jgi:uncharacterized Zn-binding protein involved in type VI secretion
MGKPAATMGHHTVGVDIHIVMVPAVAPVPTPLPHPFDGVLDGNLVQTVKLAGQPAAVQGSTSTNTPPHLPTPPGVSFQRPPANRGTVLTGSATVLIGGKPAARAGDPVTSCNDPADAPVSQVVAAGTVLIGG